MEPSSERDYQDRRVGPTVSKEKWVNHARAKMSRGYVLIVGKERKNANFYLRNKGFEMCPYNIAKQMIKEGIVVEAGSHHLGTVYKLADHAVPVEPKRKAVAEEHEEEEVEALLDDVVDDAQEETDTDAEAEF